MRHLAYAETENRALDVKSLRLFQIVMKPQGESLVGKGKLTFSLVKTGASARRIPCSVHKMHHNICCKVSALWVPLVVVYVNTKKGELLVQ